MGVEGGWVGEWAGGVKDGWMVVPPFIKEETSATLTWPRDTGV